jgi:carboxypeptidase PM20D1
MIRLLKYLLAILVMATMLVVAVVSFNFWQLKPEKIPRLEPVAYAIDSTRAVSNLAKAISFQTVSTDLTDPVFLAFREWVKATYPLVHNTMDQQTLGGGTLLFTWAGSRSEQMPVVLAGHYDVVPVNPGTLEGWTHPPFAGTVSDGYVWGRGALDNKGAVIAMMEAAEALIGKGFQPERTIYFSFGHDEEVGGSEGAAAVVEWFQEEGIEVAWSLDEGSFVLDGIFPGLEHPVASINVAEKGFMTLLITAKGAGGHSSMPPRETAVGSLARAIVAIQEQPLPGGLNGVAENMFRELAPHLGFSQRLMFSNLWLFGPFLESELSRNPSTDALLRTTTAPTMLSGSIKENVLPTTAIATINFRIHPRDTADGVLKHIRALVENDKIEVSVLNDRKTQPSPVSSQQSEGYSIIAKGLRQTFGELVVIPGLTLAGTDSKHYSKVAVDSYRINPFVLERSEVRGIHGIDERISVANLEKGVAAFMRIIEQL